jgi:polyisoprenoid-binding protein YceI
MIRRSAQSIAVFAAVIAAAGAADGSLSAPSNAKVAFTAVGPVGLKIEGKTNDLNVAEKDGNLVVDVPLANLTTGIALRDQHMKEKYLETGKFPSAALTVARAALKMPAVGASLQADVPATVTIHGQTKPLTIHYAATGEAGGFSVDGAFHVKMNEFGIAMPIYASVTVKPDVEVKASFKVAGN